MGKKDDEAENYFNHFGIKNVKTNEGTNRRKAAAAQKSTKPKTDPEAEKKKQIQQQKVTGENVAAVQAPNGEKGKDPINAWNENETLNEQSGKPAPPNNESTSATPNQLNEPADPKKGTDPATATSPEPKQSNVPVESNKSDDPNVAANTAPSGSATPNKSGDPGSGKETAANVSDKGGSKTDPSASNKKKKEPVTVPKKDTKQQDEKFLKWITNGKRDDIHQCESVLFG